jgi:hypothetical protein
MTQVFGEESGAGIVKVVPTSTPLPHGASLQLECVFGVGRPPKPERTERPARRSNDRYADRGGDRGGDRGERNERMNTPGMVRVFVGGIAPSVQDSALREFIEQECGEEPTACKVLYDRLSGVSKGCAIVEMSNEAATEIIAKAEKKDMELEGW